MFPIFLDLRQRLCVVVGGGEVGQRKTAALLAAEARVRLVCLEPRPAEETAPKLEWLCEPFRPEHLDGAHLVFAAATPAVNRTVVAEAGRRGIWTNSADALSVGDFHVAAAVRRGDFVIAIGTGGAAPGLASAIRRRLESQFDAAYGTWVAMLGEMRSSVRIQIKDPHRRRRAYRLLCHGRWLKRLRRGDAASVRQDMERLVRSLANRPESDL